LSDVFPTAFHATELACVSAGKSVAVFGAGPVGLLSAYCPLLKGASEVYVVDSIPERLAKATELLMGPQGFHQAINPISRQAEDGIHVPINECLDKNIGCGHDLYSQSLRTNRRSKHQKVNLLSCVARLREKNIGNRQYDAYLNSVPHVTGGALKTPGTTTANPI
jgi:threonine dehydrogenase-like Zn-dependent dehydrogenase